MSLRVGPLAIPWPGKSSSEDPYWDFFLNTPPNDLSNMATEIIRRAPQGAVNPAKSDLHTPEVTSSHIKEFALWLGADLVGIVRLEDSTPCSNSPATESSRSRNAVDGDADPFAIVSAVRAEHDPREAPGIGGQIAVQNGLFVTFVLSAYIRELGYRATGAVDPRADRLAARAGLGSLDKDGRLVTRKYGSRVHLADVIRTDLPLAPDG